MTISTAQPPMLSSTPAYTTKTLATEMSAPSPRAELYVWEHASTVASMMCPVKVFDTGFRKILNI